MVDLRDAGVIRLGDGHAFAEAGQPVLVVGDLEVQVPTEVTGLDRGRQGRELKTGIDDGTQVLPLLRETAGRGKVAIDKQAVGLVAVPVHVEGQPVADADLGTDVELVGLLPLQVGVRHLGSRGGGVVIILRAVGERLEILARADVLHAGLTPADLQLEVGDGRRLEEFLVADHPRRRNAREHGRAVLLVEGRGLVDTERSVEEVLVGVVVRGLGDEGLHARDRLGTGDVLAVGSHAQHIQAIRETLAFTIYILVPGTLGLVAGEGVEGVIAPLFLDLEHVGADAAIVERLLAFHLVAGLHVFHVSRTMVVESGGAGTGTGLRHEREPGSDLGLEHEIVVHAEALGSAGILFPVGIADQRVLVVAGEQVGTAGERNEVAFGVVRAVPCHALEHVVNQQIVRLVLLVGPDIEVVGDGQPLGKIHRVVRTRVEFLVAGVLQGTLFVVVGNTVVEGILGRSAGYREVMAVEQRILVDQAAPVRIGVHHRPGRDFLHGDVVHEARFRVAVVLTVVLVQLAGVHQALAAEIGLGHTDRRLPVELQLVTLGFLGGDDDHTAVGLGAVHTGGTGVLQDRHRLHIIGIIGSADDTVHHVERLLRSVHGRSTTDADGGRGTRQTAAVDDGNAGDLALKHVGDVAGHDILELLFVHDRDGAGDFTSCLGGIAHDDDFVQQLLVFIHGQIDCPLVAHGNLFGLETDAGENQDGIRTADRDGIMTIHVRDHTVHGSFLHDTDTHKRLVVTA